MRLVAARQAEALSRAVTAESWGARNLAVGHEDGSISLYDKNLALQLVWLNAGERVASLTAIDVCILAAFTSGTLRLLSVDTGLVIAETRLPFAVAGVHVLEHYLACWGRLSPKVWILQRSNLDVWQCIDTDSAVLSVFSASNALGLVCSSHAYTLKLHDDGQYVRRRVLQTSAPFIAGTMLGQRWLLVRPSQWSLFSLGAAADTLDEEFKVDPPDGALFCGVVLTHLGAFLLCNTGATVLVKDNNIQVLPAPRPEQGHWTSDALVVWPDLSLSEAHAVRGEVLWQDRRLPVAVTTTKFLLGNSDPNVTAIYGDYVGTADGRINGTAVLPGPILHIDEAGAQSRLGSVALPLQDVNVVVPPKEPEHLVDMRVSVKTAAYTPDSADASSLIGVRGTGWAALRPMSANLPAPLLALLVLEGHRSVHEILLSSDASLTTVAQLEDLIVTAAAADDGALCQTVASILDKIWSSRRVAELMQSAGPRSLQVLSAVYPYVDIPKSALQALIVSMLDGPRPDREAVLWVYEHKLGLVDDLVIPFASLKGLSEDTVSRFAETMAKRDSAKLLRDARTVVSAASPALAAAAGAAAVSVDDSADSLAEAHVMKVLLAALSSPGPPAFPPSDEALARLVALVSPAMHERVPGAKKILAKLLSQSQVQYHQGKQRLLVPTPTEPSHAALVFEFSDSTHEPVVLQRAPATTQPDARQRDPRSAPASQMVFSADGKSVYAPTASGRLVWHFSGALRALFRSKQPIQPVVEH